MTPMIPIALALSCAACWTTEHSQLLIGGEGRVLRGAASNGTGTAGQFEIGYGGVVFGSELSVRNVQRGDETRTVVGLDDLVRVSIPGVLPTDHELDHDIDFGFEAGAGGAIGAGGGLGEAYGGGWAEVRISGIHEGIYTALTFGARKEWLTSWNDQTIYTFGIARRSRD